MDDVLSPVMFAVIPDPPDDRPHIARLLKMSVMTGKTCIILGLSPSKRGGSPLELRGALQLVAPKSDGVPPVEWWELKPGQHPLDQ